MKVNGTLLKLFITIGGTKTQIADTRDISLNLSIATINTTTRDSGGWEEKIGGVRSFTTKCTGYTDLATAAGKAKLGDLIGYGIARLPVDFEFSTGTTGDKSWSGSAIISSVAPQAAHEGEFTWSMDAEGTGALVQAAIV